MSIIAKYGVQVLRALKKTENLDVSMVCPLHGICASDRSRYFPHNEFIPSVSIVDAGVSFCSGLFCIGLWEYGICCTAPRVLPGAKGNPSFEVN